MKLSSLLVFQFVLVLAASKASAHVIGVTEEGELEIEVNRPSDAPVHSEKSVASSVCESEEGSTSKSSTALKSTSELPTTSVKPPSSRTPHLPAQPTILPLLPILPPLLPLPTILPPKISLPTLLPPLSSLFPNLRHPNHRLGQHHDHKGHHRNHEKRPVVHGSFSIEESDESRSA